MRSFRIQYYSRRRLARICCIALSILFVCMPLYAASATDDETEQNAGTLGMQNALASLLVEASTQTTLVEHEADTLSNVAGLSKLPALLVVCEAVDSNKLNLDTALSVSERAAGISGPTAFVEGGESILAAHLMKAAVMIGAGDAIMAMGEHAFGSESDFLLAVQTRLEQLSIPIQLSDPIGIGTQFSPRMLAKLGAEIMKSPCFQEHSKLTLETIPHADGRETELASSNRMLRTYAGCGGVMTGSSPADGYCGVFSVMRGDTHLIAVVIGSENSSERFSAAGDMLDAVFSTTRAQKLSEKGEVVKGNVRVRTGKLKEVNLVAKETIVLLLEKSEPSLEAIEDIPSILYAPLNTTDVLGTITYQTSEGEVRGRVELVAEAEVVEYKFRNIVSDMMLYFIRM